MIISTLELVSLLFLTKNWNIKLDTLLNKHLMNSPIYKILHIKTGLLLLCTLLSLNSTAQIESTLCGADYQIDSTETKDLRLSVENMNFFKDNEFAGSVMKGYSLPGLWVIPQLTYQPLDNIKLEAGMYALMYHGAYKYPNYAYQDIAKWKGNQYQKGAHLLPIFRAQLALHNTNIIIGHLYGGETHQLILPMYNPELNLTADPGNGVQVLFDTRLLHLDAWLNWESFIFDNSTHQESFIVGLSSRIKFNRPEAKCHFYMPIQGLAQHRGGEQDTARSVQTLMNGAIGAGMRWNINRPAVKWVNFEADLLGYYEQAGDIWPFAGGSAQMLSAEIMFAHNLHLCANYFHSNQFISMLGSPYFGSVSTKNLGAKYCGHPQTLHIAFDYSRTFGKFYAFGAKAEAYYVKPGDMTEADGPITPTNGNFNSSFGVYFRINPSFLLKKF